MRTPTYIFSNLPEVVQPLKKHYFQETIPFISNSYALPSQWDTVSVFIIVEPFVINHKYCSVSSLWKKYLFIHFPNIKLILMGFLDFQGPNYIDLLNMPKDFHAFVQNALHVGSDYDIPIDGMNCHDAMRQFFKGHGKDSLISQLNKIQQSLNVAYTNLLTGSNDFQEIRDSLLIPYFMPEWKELKRRWDVYYPFFEYLPFFSTMKSIDETFRKISQAINTNDIDENIFLQGHLDDKIATIANQLIQIDKNYIRPEIYNEK